jgi:hypothetical protein
MLEKLRSILKQPDAVLFIGSGVSIWSGLPTWHNLIIELSEFLFDNGIDPQLVIQEANRQNLLQAASYGFDKLTKPQISEFLRKACRLGIAQPSELHKKLINLGPKCYVTTNYDKLIELSFQKWHTGGFYKTVLNRQLIETADIVSTHSTRG